MSDGWMEKAPWLDVDFCGYPVEEEEEEAEEEERKFVGCHNGMGIHAVEADGTYDCPNCYRTERIIAEVGFTGPELVAISDVLEMFQSGDLGANPWEQYPADGPNGTFESFMDNLYEANEAILNTLHRLVREVERTRKGRAEAQEKEYSGDNE